MKAGDKVIVEKDNSARNGQEGTVKDVNQHNVAAVNMGDGAIAFFSIDHLVPAE